MRRSTRPASLLIAVVLLVALLPTLPGTPAARAAANALSFMPPAYLDTNAASFFTTSVAAGDLNADGAIDIVLGNSAQPSQIYLNDGSGSFSPVLAPLNPGADTTSAAVGDLNGDGALDIVLGNNGQPSQTYMNNGAALFTPAVALNSPLGNATQSVALGDLNADGRLDIVLGNSGEPSLIYLNQGSGSFPTPVALNMSNSTTDVALGDLNSDGKLDILLGNASEPSLIYLNQGGGSFATPVALNAGGISTTSVALGDLDGNGKLDIAITDVNSGIQAYLNDSNGSGSFTPASSPSVGASGSALGDLNGDGALDLVLVHFSLPNRPYLNDGHGGFTATDSLLNRPFGLGTHSVVVADFNGDGAIDIILGNSGIPSQIYLSNGYDSFTPTSNPISLSSTTQSAALGDLDGDGALDLVLANGNRYPPQPSLVYLNDKRGGFLSPTSMNPSGNDTASVAIGDLDSDGDLDLVLGNNGQPSQVYLNNGLGAFPVVRALNTPSGESTQGVALGDLDSDGDLDIILGNNGQPSRAYLNDGHGIFTALAALNPSGDSTNSVAVGDLNGDGALDIVLGNSGQPSQVYLNDGHSTFPTVSLIAPHGNYTSSVAVGDLNGDGALDIVLGNSGQPSQAYLNDGLGGFSPSNSLIDLIGSSTNSVALGDLNGDGALDLVVGNGNSMYSQTSQVYLNDGNGRFSPTASPLNAGDITQSVALGDVNGDGALDIVLGNNAGSSQIYLNHLATSARLPNDPPTIAVRRPDITDDSGFFSTPEILSDRVISIPYTLADREGDPAREIKAFYSLDGGGLWREALPASPPDLTASPAGATHTFAWDTFASGFFGQSDNVVIRLVAYPALSTGISGVPLFQRPYAAAASFPFRVRGTQVRVIDSQGRPAPNALVYRLPAGATEGAARFPPVAAGQAERQTDGQGYLQGRGQLSIDDQLVAMVPITSTAAYTAYQTSAAPSAAGLDLAPVAQPGVQTLTVTPDHQLILFKLSIALEWDARGDPDYLARLEGDIQRASALLYDWTDGQAALGEISVYQNRERWGDANIRIYASNALRPNAVRGGIVPEGATLADPDNPAISYTAGQLRMGATWNRYGEPGANLGEDWPRTLAHELGHYALFLDDNYLGLDANGQLITVSSCAGAMSDPYTNNDSELHPSDASWGADCAQTLSQRSSGRSDWASILRLYNNSATGVKLSAPAIFDAQPGPTRLPLAITQVTLHTPVGINSTLRAPIFFTLGADGARSPAGPGARAFLFQADRLVDLGRPVGEQVLARGARPGERLCVFDPANQRFGCHSVDALDQSLPFTGTLAWRPEISLTPVNSTTIQLELRGLPAGLSATARLFPALDSAQPSVALSTRAGIYVGQLSSRPDQPAFEGAINIQLAALPGAAPRYETVVDYILGGNPGRKWAGRAPRGNPGRKWAGRSPVVSNDGEAILYEAGQALDEGEFYLLQATDSTPAAPAYARPLGRAYRLSATPGVDLSAASLSMSYRGEDVAAEYEGGIGMYFYDGQSWQLLPSVRRDVQHNEVSAPLRGAGLYQLMVSVDVALSGPGWNSAPYLGASIALPAALDSLAGAYRMVYAFDAGDPVDPWKLYAHGVPAYVNDLAGLEYSRVYWIYASTDATLRARPRASALAAASAGPRMPPATFYGAVTGGSRFTPAAGQSVLAMVGDAICGQGQTRSVAGLVVYSVAVESLGPQMPGCGAPGLRVRFIVGGHALAPDAPWDSALVQAISLSPDWKIALPLIRR